MSQRLHDILGTRDDLWVSLWHEGQEITDPAYERQHIRWQAQDDWAGNVTFACDQAHMVSSLQVTDQPQGGNVIFTTDIVPTAREPQTWMTIRMGAIEPGALPDL